MRSDNPHIQSTAGFVVLWYPEVLIKRRLSNIWHTFPGNEVKTSMKKDKNDPKNKQFKKTQYSSSPGALGEDANRSKKQSSNPIGEDNTRTSKQPGLNEEQSAGDAGAFEGLENMQDS